MLRQVEGEEPINASMDDNENPRYQTDSFRMLYMKVRLKWCWEGGPECGFRPSCGIPIPSCFHCSSGCIITDGEQRNGCVGVLEKRRTTALQVLPCCKRFVHDWSDCPFSHPGEKARRRDPKVHQYTGIACPDMKKVGPGKPGAGQ